MPVKEIEVKLTSPTGYKIASWWLPYRKKMVGERAGHTIYLCRLHEYAATYNVILNGLRSRVLFDCNRGLRGIFLDEEETDYRKAQLHPVKYGTVGARYYNGVCRAVTGKDAYLSK
jgi:hypothetical protein